MEELVFKNEYYEIVGAAIQVWKTLGYGFLEKVYENALVIELMKQGYKAEKQKPIAVFYDGQQVGDYFADLVVNDQIILELKTAHEIASEHTAQILNYLKATKAQLGILLNFGPKGLEHRRYVM